MNIGARTFLLITLGLCTEQAGALVRVTPEITSLALDGALEMLIEEGGSWSVDEVSRAPLNQRFQPAGESAANLGLGSKAVWVRLNIALPSQATQPYLLQLRYTQVDRVDCYTRVGAGPWQRQLAGDARAFAVRQMAHPTPVFPLPAATGEPLSILLRLETDGSLQFPLTVWRQDAFLESSIGEQLALGAYFAFLAAMVIYNAFLFLVVRDASYLYYVTYLGGVLLFQMALEGHAGMYLWPASAAWNDVAVLSLLGVLLAGGLMFVREMTNARAYAPRLARSMLVLAGLALLTLPSVWFAYTLSLYWILALALISLLLFPWPIGIAVYRGYRPAWYLVLGYASLLPGGLLLVLHYLGILETSLLVRHALQAGTAAEAMLLSFALADRIKLLREQRDDAQALAMVAQQRALAQQEAFSRRLLQTQDAERRRIARDLHDGFGQMLAAASNRMLAWKRATMPPEPAEIDQMAEQAQAMVGEVRGLAHNLHPHQLDHLGLSAALQAVADQVASTGSARVQTHIAEIDGRLPPEAELHLYRIVQEALHNASRHARAANIHLSVTEQPGVLRIAVSDDGRGFETDSDSAGLGLTGMRERARAIGAQVSLESGQSGTEITVTVRLDA